jgi:3-methylcrotonyl-CoA carboxylase alpha subunit
MSGSNSDPKMFGSVLIANRGEIALRILRTARRMGLRCIAVHSDAERDALHVRLADQAICIGGAAPADSYLRGDRVIDAALRTGAEAIHPGYGFLSENADFAEACAAAGLAFIGPPPSAIRAMGLKDHAKDLMERAGVPVVPGYHGADQSDARLVAEAASIGTPLLIKATAGGGGKGMKRVDRLEDFGEALASARREAQAAFGLADVLLETYVTRPRHIEVQIFADRQGDCVHLFERDCSLQRRHQKVMEEAPAPGMPAEMRDRMTEAATAAARAVGYVGAGTVEFIAESDDKGLTGRFWFMEMNTRLQVEHPVTEAITGLDLVEWQFRVAAGEPLPLAQAQIGCRGHAVEARLYAEDPARDFLPSTGRLAAFDVPAMAGLRIDAGIETGGEISPFYDPMIAKIITHGGTRSEALDRMAQALRATRVAGPRTNLPLLLAMVDVEDFRAGRFDTGFIGAHPLVPHALSDADLQQGLHALLQSQEGRGPWDLGDAFQLSGPRVQSFDVLIDGEPRRMTCDWSQPAVRGDADVVVDGAAAYVLRAGWQTDLRLHDPFESRAVAAAADDAVIRAPMHGRVVALHVREGERVEKGQRLAIVEAMKMEHVLVAGVAGIVARVAVAAGAQVALGAPLITIHAGEEPHG